LTNTTIDKNKKIKASLGFGRMPDADLLKRLDAIHLGMSGNPAFPNPPIEMATFKKAIDDYSALITDALDGGKRAISAKQKQRDAVTQIATLLGHYVEVATNNDLATFNNQWICRGFQNANSAAASAAGDHRLDRPRPQPWNHSGEGHDDPQSRGLRFAVRRLQ
jgi:hypothetical protein